MELTTRNLVLAVCTAAAWLIGAPDALQAQTPAPEPDAAAVPQVPTPEPTPVAAAQAPAAEAAPPVAEPPASAPASSAVEASAAVCLIGGQGGLAAGDARTGAALVCDALRQAGARVSPEPVTQPNPGDHSAYRIDVLPLGKLVILQVSYESPIGTRIDSRSLRLNGIEEVVIAAPRLAESLVRGTPIAATAKVDSLVGQETRKYEKEYGETLFGLGIMGFALPDDTWAGYGVVVRLYYESLRYAVGAEARLGTSSAGDGDSHLAGIGLGARYFFNEADISPFVGGGAGILWFGTSRKFEPPSTVPPMNGLYGYSTDDEIELDGSGLALFTEVGVEFLRLHGSRLDTSLRLDVPTFRLHGYHHARYTMPISLLVTYSFD